MSFFNKQWIDRMRDVQRIRKFKRTRPWFRTWNQEFVEGKPLWESVFQRYTPRIKLNILQKESNVKYGIQEISYRNQHVFRRWSSQRTIGSETHPRRRQTNSILVQGANTREKDPDQNWENCVLQTCNRHDSHSDCNGRDHTRTLTVSTGNIPPHASSYGRHGIHRGPRPHVHLDVLEKIRNGCTKSKD